MPGPEIKQLGRLIRIYRSQPLGWKDFFFLILPGALAVIIPLAYGYTRFRTAHLGYGPVAAQLWSRPWYVLALVALSVFIVAAIARIQSTRQFVAVHEQGLYLALNRKAMLRWGEIAGVSLKSTRYHLLGKQFKENYSGTLYPNTGKSIHLSDAIQNLPELLSLLKARLYPRLLPHLQANLESGQWLFFGPLAIQKDGLKLTGTGLLSRSQSIAWTQVAHIDVSSGYLVVELSDKTSRKLPVSKIPNIELLLQLIRMGVNS